MRFMKGSPLNANEKKQARPCAKERPILFSAPMVQAILAGRKTQTRRIVKKWYFNTGNEGMNIAFSGLSSSEVSPGFWKLSSHGEGGAWNERCAAISPYGKPGDQLYVRETAIISPVGWCGRNECGWTHEDSEGNVRVVQYLATSPNRDAPNDYKLKATPSIHMPRWASRITLEITEVRVQRLQEISRQDAIAEGISVLPLQSADNLSAWWQSAPGVNQARTPQDAYCNLWDNINGAGNWDANPWVWALTFKVVQL